jgi:glycosyltransferase involved in cell wall biosynthesis
MSYQISIVIPVFNEEENVQPLHEEVVKVCEREGFTYEIIYIDDGSTDATVGAVKKLSPVRLIRLRKNFGQTAAMDAGIKAAQYDLIITMDGDRQNDPNDIPKLIRHLDENEFDIVSGWRIDRKDPFMKRFVSRGANRLRKLLINDGIHDSGCSLKVYRRRCFQHVNLYGEMHRFIPAVLKIKGFKVGEVAVNHRPRTAGVTKYTFKRTIKGFIDMISVWYWQKYAVRPLHLLGTIGLLIIGLSFFFGGLTLFDYFRGQDLSETITPMLTLFSFLVGVQIFILGLMSDVLVKTYYEQSDDVSYSISEVYDSEAEPPLQMKETVPTASKSETK